jgi:hypothetical protein
MKLWHDDVRPPPDDSWDLWARTNDAARDFLASGVVTECSLDHDLGMDEIELPDDVDEALDILADHQRRASETGLDLVNWMVTMNIVPAKVTIHSWNPSGAANMAARLNRYGHNCFISPYRDPN